MDEFHNLSKKVNSNAVALVLLCVNKLYQIMQEYAHSIMNSEINMSEKSIRRLFIHVYIIFIILC